MSDTFLAALALKWRELRDAPQLAAGTLGFFPAREAVEMRRLCRDAAAPVPYTHLTLPTNRKV